MRLRLRLSFLLRRQNMGKEKSFLLPILRKTQTANESIENDKDKGEEGENNLAAAVTVAATTIIIVVSSTVSVSVPVPVFCCFWLLM